MVCQTLKSILSNYIYTPEAATAAYLFLNRDFGKKFLELDEDLKKNYNSFNSFFKATFDPTAPSTGEDAQESSTPADEGSSGGGGAEVGADGEVAPTGERGSQQLESEDSVGRNSAEISADAIRSDAIAELLGAAELPSIPWGWSDET